MEVGGEELGGGEELIFDHYVNVIVVEAFAHVSIPWKSEAIVWRGSNAAGGIGCWTYSTEGGAGGGDVEGVRPGSH